MKTGKEVSEAAKKCAEDCVRVGYAPHFSEGNTMRFARVIQLAIDAQLANARNDALEECAKECDDAAGEALSVHATGELFRVAARIRELRKGPNHV
jgi:hypothetical protein